ncbi:MAG: hypothetical protein KBS91_02635, partial [Firmicutes bacterium]|nr:hypothetical protein [Candidatus Caballimonas caccae]
MEFGVIAALVILDIVFTIAVIVWNMSKKKDKEVKVEPKTEPVVVKEPEPVKVEVKEEPKAEPVAPKPAPVKKVVPRPIPKKEEIKP